MTCNEWFVSARPTTQKIDSAEMVQHSRSPVDVVIGVFCLLLVTVTTLIGPHTAHATAWTGAQRQPQRGCLPSRLCCTGKNSTCRVQGPRTNDPRSRTCYCDTACFATNDCCADLQLACNISRLRRMPIP